VLKAEAKLVSLRTFVGHDYMQLLKHTVAPQRVARPNAQHTVGGVRHLLQINPSLCLHDGASCAA
jgi:hypothetical protein